MELADILIKRRRLMRQYRGRFQQNEVAMEAGISSNTLVDIEREKITVAEDDLLNIDAAMDRLERKARAESLTGEEVMA